MKVRTFFEILKRYPDWNVDLVIEDKANKKLIDIKDIVCDERNGNLIIETGKKPMTSWEAYIEYLQSWADTHANNVCMYQSPATYDEWLDNEAEEEEDA